MRNLNWPSERQRTAEFDLAKHLFAFKQITRSCLKKSHLLHQDTINTHPLTGELLRTTHTYFQDDNNEIFAYDENNPFSHGGFGSITLAESIDGQLWVLKRLRRSSRDDFSSLEKEVKFTRKSGLAARALKNVNGTPAILLPYLGISLGAYLKLPQPIDDAQRFFIFLQVCHLVYHLHHTHHIAHRDIKPENLIIDQYNRVHLIDFGLADNNPDALLDNQARIAGSVFYIPPSLFSQPKRILTLQQHDVFATLRTACIDTIFLIYNPKHAKDILEPATLVIYKNRQPRIIPPTIFTDDMFLRNTALQLMFNHFDTHGGNPTRLPTIEELYARAYLFFMNDTNPNQTLNSTERINAIAKAEILLREHLKKSITDRLESDVFPTLLAHESKFRTYLADMENSIRDKFQLRLKIPRYNDYKFVFLDIFGRNKQKIETTLKEISLHSHDKQDKAVVSILLGPALIKLRDSDDPIKRAAHEHFYKDKLDTSDLIIKYARIASHTNGIRLNADYIKDENWEEMKPLFSTAAALINLDLDKVITSTPHISRVVQKKHTYAFFAAEINAPSEPAERKPSTSSCTVM